MLERKVWVLIRNEEVVAYDENGNEQILTQSEVIRAYMQKATVKEAMDRANSQVSEGLFYSYEEVNLV